MRDIPWGGRSPRELTRAHMRFKLAPEGASSTVVSDRKDKSESSSEQLELFPSEEEFERGS